MRGITMALWKGNEPEKDAPTTMTRPTPPPPSKPAEATLSAAPSAPERAPAPAPRAAVAESVVATGLIIDGKIQGTGHLRISGQFNGDIHVDGNLTIESGAKVTGGVVAKRITVGGELQGNIDSASAVELTATGVMTGDLKAGSLTVAAGSRMRGQVEFGWEDKDKSSRSSGSPA
jgi:cytoskeletal protein CcmA (bactofilin family)